MIEEMGVEVVALAADVGQGGDWDAVRQRALGAGAVEAVVVDCREEFARDFVAPTLKANAKYEGKYPLVSALSRPVIVKHLVAAARQHGADAVAHVAPASNDSALRGVAASAGPPTSTCWPPCGCGASPRGRHRLLREQRIPLEVTR